MKPLLVLLLLTAAPPVAAVPAAQVRVHSEQVRIAPQRSSQDFTIDCRSGEQLLSGGFRGVAPDLTITGSHPSASGTGWTVRVLNRSRLTHALDIGVRCVAGEFRSSAESASCPSGTVVTGGGYLSATPVTGSHPAGRGWAVEGGSDVKVYAVCVTGLKPGAIESMTLDLAEGSRTGAQTVTCLGTLAGGGYEVIDGRPAWAIVTSFGDQDTWQVAIAGGGPLSLRVTAICVDLPSTTPIPARDEVLPIIAGGCVVAGLLLALVLVMAARLRNRGRIRGQITVELRSHRSGYRLDELQEVQ